MIVIDGYNLLYALHGIEHDMPIKDLQNARTELHEMLSRFFNITSEHLLVVYDARSGNSQPSEERAGLRVVYAPANASADDYIVRFVQKSKRPTHITVVTSDKGLAERLKEFGAKVMKSSSFHKRVLEAFEKGPEQTDDGKAFEKPGRPSLDEIDLFLDAFSDDTRKRGPDEPVE